LPAIYLVFAAEHRADETSLDDLQTIGERAPV
jgi:hypothetical protein